MISSIRISGFPMEYFENRHRVISIGNSLRVDLLEDFLPMVKSDPSIAGKEDEREIKIPDFFPIYYQKDEFLRESLFVTVEVHVARCVLTRSVYWAEQLTLFLRKFFAPIISADNLNNLNLGIRYEVIEAKFVDNGLRTDN